ncbi:TniQ family protein [Streptomyces bobili]|uniref:hypothetical protein n=1 Tax=Streptomyces bobili TaxID=67280 RepID=UPI002255F37C|nr:hypothetical protein [Streptomyces bobili]MCX5522695.1 TniQ family protein [Streptomyces bobili]
MIAKLPFQVRPIASEGIHPFITRLAHANCLPPAVLRGFLVGPPTYLGTPSWERLAAVTGRDTESLRKTLNTITCKECGADFLLHRAYGHQPRYCSARCRTRPSLKRKAITAPCRICQQPMKLHSTQIHRLCSSACRRTAYERRRKITRGEEEPSDCSACEGPHYGDPLSVHQTFEVACSAACRQELASWLPLAPSDVVPMSAEIAIFNLHRDKTASVHLR